MIYNFLYSGDAVGITFVYHGIKNSGLPVWRFQNTVASLYGVFVPGPSQSEVVSYFWSWDPNTVVSLYGASKIQWPYCIALFLIFNLR